jgi:glycopeptide antibiotics resistance protein
LRSGRSSADHYEKIQGAAVSAKVQAETASLHDGTGRASGMRCAWPAQEYAMCGKWIKKGVLSESMIRNTTRNQKLGWVLFIAYLALLVYFMFFAESFGRNPDLREYSYNLEPFKEIRRFYKYRKLLGMEAFLLNIAGNVVGFMPCGFFLPIISRRSKKFCNTFLFSFCLSLCIEITQLVFRVGSFDVDDLFLNTLGGVLGFFTHWMIQKVRIRRRKRR